MTNDPSQPSSLPPAAIAALLAGHIIEAIKVVRQERNIGLKEAKDAVDAYVRTQPELQKRTEAMQAEQRQGCLRWIAVIAILVALTAYWFWTRGT